MGGIITCSPRLSAAWLAPPTAPDDAYARKTNWMLLKCVHSRACEREGEGNRGWGV